MKYNEINQIKKTINNKNDQTSDEEKKKHNELQITKQQELHIEEYIRFPISKIKKKTKTKQE